MPEIGPAPAGLPDGMRVYAVGDIHGRADLLAQLEGRIRADVAARPVDRALIVYLGDFVDRGPHSREVIEYLHRAGGDGVERRFLTGNHEETLLNFLADPKVLRSWREFGALETLYSYGVDVRDAMRGGGFEEAHAALVAALPPGHLEFFNRLETMLVIGGYCFVHAGLKPGVPIERQVSADLLWIRDEFLNYPGDFGAVVVHGHTPVAEPARYRNRINVDTGAYLTGRLTAVVLEQRDVAFMSAV